MNQKQIKGRDLRYKWAMLSELNLRDIREEFWEINDACGEVRYYTEFDDGTLLNALDGDEEEEYEFKMLFSDLSAQCDELFDMLADKYRYVTEYFDDFMSLIGGGSRYRMLGWDSYEEDYFALTGFEEQVAQTVSGRRIKRLTKDEILSVAAQCFGIIVSFFDIRYKYDYLKASFDILLDKNTSYLELIKDIDKAYEACDAADWEPYCDAVREFERRVKALPDKAWCE